MYASSIYIVCQEKLDTHKIIMANLWFELSTININDLYVFPANKEHFCSIYVKAIITNNSNYFTYDSFERNAKL
jgi:hypothetical protein